MVKQFLKKYSTDFSNFSQYFRIENGNPIFSDDIEMLVKRNDTLNVNSILHYLFSDNLVSILPFSSIFKEINRLPPGCKLSIINNKAHYTPLFYKSQTQSKLKTEYFKTKSKSDIILFSGGLDSSIIAAINTDNKNLVHLNYHGKGSRTNIIAKNIAGALKLSLIEIDFQPDEFDHLKYEKKLEKAFIGVQSPSQFIFHNKLAKLVKKLGNVKCYSGQNSDTMLYVDHYHAPTQLILHERFNRIITGFKKRMRLWFYFDENQIKNNIHMLSEHVDTEDDLQNYVKAINYNFMENEYAKLNLEDFTGLKRLKVLRWFRSSCNANDVFEALRKQTDVTRVAILNNKDFLQYAIQLLPSIMNLILVKYELSKLYSYVTGNRHRNQVVRAILKNFFVLQRSKKLRAKEEKLRIKFDKNILIKCVSNNHSKIMSLLNEIHDKKVSDYYSKCLKKEKLSSSDFTFLHKILNLALYLGRIRSFDNKC